MAWLVFILYSLALLYIFLFSLSQLHLTWHFLREKRTFPTKAKNLPPPDDWPFVTIQLPVYNEKYVIRRLIKAITSMDYPADKLEIQILDDSDDETATIIRDIIHSIHGVTIDHVRRPDRIGYKAGALQYGLKTARGEFIAIFDADFMPQPDFLKQTIPLFNKGVGVVQTRWGHLNRDYSLLTRLQAFGLDAHFSVEQMGRSHAKSFINFNGTGGVWRKDCIIDAGGWSADTLTEDLDLSYRAQLKGWKFKYLEECVAPAELPVIMSAIKSQQYRWNKGAAETARKSLSHVFRSSLPWTNKIHALFHLLNSSVFVGLLVAAVLSIPLLFIKTAYPQLDLVFRLGGVFLLGFFSIAYFYWIAAKHTTGKGYMKYYFTTFPLFIIVSMGLSLHNGLAVAEGLAGRRTPFIRTPKFNITSEKSNWHNNTYIRMNLSPLTLLEGIFSLYFIFGVIAGVIMGDLTLALFHTLLATGFGIVFFYSIKSFRHG
ncbi:MAG: glycosyltransferase family 2 protein [Cyclobacteriaceae bacterium]|nr:glycosyltransferase family 2 protein [Cyclobacteriaceae bacterium]